MKRAKGFWGRKSTIYRVAREAVMRALRFNYIGRRLRRRDMRRLWIQRINAAARLNGTTYSRLIPALNNANIQLNRKTLAYIAMHYPNAFEAVVKTAQVK